MYFLRDFRRRQMGMDVRVWVSLLTFCCLGLIMLGYSRSRKQGRMACDLQPIKAFQFGSANNSSFVCGENIIFKAGGHDVQWDFGDQSKTESGNTVSHLFDREGNYKISARTGNGCESWMLLAIGKNLKEHSQLSTLVTPAQILGPGIAMAGLPERFFCSVPASAYEWKVLNDPDFPVQVGGEAAFTFPSAGKYTLELELNHDRRTRVLKELQVFDPSPKSRMPEVPVRLIPEHLLARADSIRKSREKDSLTAIKPSVDTITAPPKQINPKGRISGILPETFASLLQEMMEGTRTMPDFDPYLCFGGETRVLVNEQGPPQTFEQFCKTVFGGHRQTIEKVSLSRDENGCVLFIRVTFKKISFFKKWLMKKKA